MTDIYAENEEDFVEKCLTSPRPCTVWMRGDFCQDKIDEICKRRGIFFFPNFLTEKNNTLYLDHKPRFEEMIKND